MGLSWQQGPLSPGAIGRFLVPEPLPQRLLYAEPLRRRMRVRFGGTWIADSEHVLLLFEPGHYPMAYFPETDIAPNTLDRIEHTTRHRDLGLTSWYTVHAGDKSASRGAWQHMELPNYASELQERIAFAWPAMDAFYEEDERILGHAADLLRKLCIRNLVYRPARLLYALVIEHSRSEQAAGRQRRCPTPYGHLLPPANRLRHARIDTSSLFGEKLVTNLIT